MNFCDEYTDYYYQLESDKQENNKNIVYTLKDVYTNSWDDKVSRKEEGEIRYKGGAKVIVIDHHIYLVVGFERERIIYKNFKHILTKEEKKDIDSIIKENKIKLYAK